MKFCYVVLIFLSVSASGQSFRKKSQGMKIRHVQGQKSVELMGGISGYGGLVGSIYYNSFYRNNVYWKLGGGYEYKQNTSGVNYSSVFSDALGGVTLMDKGSFFLNAVGGMTLGFDNVAGIETQKKTSGFIYGVAFGLEGEVYVTNNIVLVLSGTERLILPKEFPNRWYAQVGLRFKL